MSLYPRTSLTTIRTWTFLVRSPLSRRGPACRMPSTTTAPRKPSNPVVSRSDDGRVTVRCPSQVGSWPALSWVIGQLGRARDRARPGRVRWLQVLAAIDPPIEFDCASQTRDRRVATNGSRWLVCAKRGRPGEEHTGIKPSTFRIDEVLKTSSGEHHVDPP